MRKFFITISLFLSLCASAQIRWNQTYQQYFDQYKDIAIEQMLKYHIPASITLAQGVYESGAGRASWPEGPTTTLVSNVITGRVVGAITMTMSAMSVSEHMIHPMSRMRIIPSSL